jgi:MFS family permease
MGVDLQPEASPRLIMISLAALLLAALDSTILSTILPTIRCDLGGSADSAWLVSGFILAQTVSVPMFGRMADTLGLRAGYAAALSLFGIGSAWMAWADQLSLAILARIVQGLGAGGIVILTYMIVAALSSAEDRPRRQGMVSGIWGLAAILGPLTGTGLEITVGWRWIFLLNLPACCLTLALLWSLCPGAVKVKAPSILRTFDLLILSSTVTLLLLALLPRSNDFPGKLRNTFGIVAVGLGVALFIRLRRAETARTWFGTHSRWLPPLVATVSAAYVLYGSVTFLPMLIQEAMHQPVVAASGAVLAGSLGWVLGSLLTGRLLVRMGYRRVAFTGALLMGSASLALGFAAQSAHWEYLIPAEFVLGVGMGGVANSALIAIQNQAGRGSLGTFTSLIHLGRSLGAAIGVNGLAAALAWAIPMEAGKGQVPASPGTVAKGFASALFTLVPVTAITAMSSLKLPTVYGVPKEDKEVQPDDHS